MNTFLNFKHKSYVIVLYLCKIEDKWITNKLVPPDWLILILTDILYFCSRAKQVLLSLFPLLLPMGSGLCEILIVPMNEKPRLVFPFNFNWSQENECRKECREYFADSDRVEYKGLVKWQSPEQCQPSSQALWVLCLSEPDWAQS